jgi:hypothetical protein
VNRCRLASICSSFGRRTASRSDRGSRQRASEPSREPTASFCRWSLEELKEVRDEFADRSEMALAHPGVYLFADHSLWAAGYGVRLSAKSGGDAPVFMVSGRVPTRVARSFTDFVEQSQGDAAGLLPRAV